MTRWHRERFFWLIVAAAVFCLFLFATHAHAARTTDPLTRLLGKPTKHYTLNAHGTRLRCELWAIPPRSFVNRCVVVPTAGAA